MTNALDLRLDPYPWYAEMRQMNPIAFSPEFNAYLVFRYEDVRRVLSDYQTFSSNVYEGMPKELIIENSIQGMDPPKHTQLRALASYAFTPMAVAELEPRIRKIANELLDRMLEKNEIDFVRDFAVPFPIAVIADMLGVPEQERARFRDWSDTIVESSLRLLTGNMEPLPEHVAAYREMKAYFRGLVQERRQNPQDDITSVLAAAEVEGRKLTDAEAGDFCILLMIAGNETTANLLGNAVRSFLEFPGQWDSMCRNRELVSQAVEETLRFRSPAQLLYRVVKQDVELGGRQLKAGEHVALFLGAANRDPEKFENPETFDISRQIGSHLALGHGIHFCMGAPLARMETKIAFEAFLERNIEFQMPDDPVVEPKPTFAVFGLSRLQVRIQTRH